MSVWADPDVELIAAAMQLRSRPDRAAIARATAAVAALPVEALPSVLTLARLVRQWLDGGGTVRPAGYDAALREATRAAEGARRRDETARRREASAKAARRRRRQAEARTSWLQRRDCGDPEMVAAGDGEDARP